MRGEFSFVYSYISSDSDLLLGDTTNGTTNRDGPPPRCPTHWRSSYGAIRIHFSSRVCQRGNEATISRGQDEGELIPYLVILEIHGISNRDWA